MIERRLRIFIEGGWYEPEEFARLVADAIEYGIKVDGDDETASVEDKQMVVALIKSWLGIDTG